jgi:hypothetical protein
MTPRVRQYAAEEGARFGLSADQVLTINRGCPAASKARRNIMVRLASERFTPGQIGRWLGRNTSTVRYAIDANYRDAHNARMKARYVERNARNRERYLSDEAYREKRKAWARHYG